MNTDQYVMRLVIHCVQKKTATHIFFHISMNDVWILKNAVNIPKER